MYRFIYESVVGWVGGFRIFIDYGTSEKRREAEAMAKNFVVNAQKKGEANTKGHVP